MLTPKSCHAMCMKVRFAVKCGRCQEWMNPGAEMSRTYGAPWHVACVLRYQAARQALVASGARR